MKILLVTDAVFAAFGAVMTLVLAVVCLLFGIYHDALPSIARDFSSLLIMTAAFTVLMVAGAIATVGVWRRRRWLWLAQAGLIAALPLVYGLVWLSLESN